MCCRCGPKKKKKKKKKKDKKRNTEESQVYLAVGCGDIQGKVELWVGVRRLRQQESPGCERGERKGTRVREMEGVRDLNLWS